jgi:nitrogen-specific signal transduction histidine kinase/CheY-like chemotaxis protein
MVKISGIEDDFYCAMLVDLSKIRQVEQELDTVQKQLMQTQKHEALGHLAGNIAHDFNNMLAVISGYADLLDFEISDASQRSTMLTEIRRAVQRGSGLTGQILAYAKGPLINMKVHDLHAVIEGLRGMIQAAAGSGIQIDYKLGAERRRVQLDETQFTQVLLNLAVNARDAMPGAGKISIGTTIIELHEEYFHKIGVTPAPGEYLKLSVEDTGSGIPENVVARIFDPYFSTKARDKGTGLGLAVVYGIVKKHKGFIFCASQENVGTTFSIYLPLAEKSAAIDGGAPKNGPAQILNIEPSKIDILIVEDEENLRQILARQLSTAGFLVHTAANGREGLDFIDKFPGKLSIVLTDISMPEMTGLDMASEARLLQPDASFLFMTGNAMALENGQAVGNIRVLKKPFNNDALMAEIKAILGERQELNLG